MFISSAFAQDAAATASSSPSPFITMAPLVVIFVLFYLLVIRPQSKRMKEHGELLKQLKAGDQVVTGGGVHGKIIKVDEKFMYVEIATGVQVKVDKHTVSAVQNDLPTDIKPVK